MAPSTRSAVRAYAIAEGGLLAALSALLSIVGGILPAGGLLFRIAACVPVVRVTARHGRRAGAATSVVVGMLFATVFGPLSGLFRFVQLAGFAVSLGWAQRRRWDAISAVALAAGGGAMTSVLGIAESYVVTGINPIAAGRLQLSLALDGVAAALPRVYAFLQVGAGVRAWAAGSLATLRLWLPTLSVLALAAFVAAYALGFAVLLYAADRAAARRVGDPLPQLPRVVEVALGIGLRWLAALRGRAGAR